MTYGHDLVCPKCGTHHGPAAKGCECGHAFKVPQEDPAKPRFYFLWALFFGAVTVISAAVAEKNGFIYMPIGGLLFTSVSFTLGVKSWFYFDSRRRNENDGG